MIILLICFLCLVFSLPYLSSVVGYIPASIARLTKLTGINIQLNPDLIGALLFCVYFFLLSFSAEVYYYKCITKKYSC